MAIDENAFAQRGNSTDARVAMSMQRADRLSALHPAAAAFGLASRDHEESTATRWSLLSPPPMTRVAIAGDAR
jgi:hypothetical protein